MMRRFRGVCANNGMGRLNSCLGLRMGTGRRNWWSARLARLLDRLQQSVPDRWSAQPDQTSADDRIFSERTRVYASLD